MARLVLALALLPTALAADATIGGQTVDCYCTDKTGSRIELGETICLEVDGRMFTAQCQMSLNVPMWRELNDGCLSSDARSRIFQRTSPQMSLPAGPAKG